MTVPDLGVADGAVIAVYVLTLMVPGGLVGLVAGLRGWALVATAPLFTYSVSGIAGPLYSAMGIRWAPLSWGLAFVAVVAVCAAARWLTRKRRGAVEPVVPRWSLPAQLGVAACTLAAVVVGVVVILGGIRSLTTIPQDWDAVFHANGIRLIADTGDGSLYAMGRVNWYEDGLQVFYPNAYHLVGAVVYELTGAQIPVVLNAHTVLIPGLLALSLVAMIRRFGGRPILAAASGLAVVSVSSVYDMLWRGPLLPFATGVALTPLLVILALDALDARGLRAAVRPALLFALGMAGLLCLHPAILIGSVLFTLPALLQRWWQRPAAAPREIAVLVAAGIVAAVGCTAQLTGTMSSAGNLSAISWPADLSAANAVGDVLLFAHAADNAQARLALVLVLGLLLFRTLGSLRWVAGTAAIFGTLFVIAASVSEPWAKTITSLWWNDRWRLIALTAVPLCVIIGQGVAEAQRGLAAVISTRGRALRRVASEPTTPGKTERLVVAVATSVVVLLAFTLLTRTFYLARDQVRMSFNTGEGPAVSHVELAGMAEVGRIVPTGSRVLNDRGDGSAWLYAMTGVKPVGGHYDAYRIGPDATLLAERFNQYPNDPSVREAVARQGIEYVMLDAGFLRGYAIRAPGLTGLAGADWLTVAYRNPDLVLYRITGVPGGGPDRSKPNAAPLLSDGSG